MPFILHLSDLHLVAPAKSRATGTHKVNLVPAGDRPTQYEVLRRTFAGPQSRLLSEGRRIDAIVMTGDVADKNSGDGYTAFLKLLEELNEVSPGPANTVVVPGNHDVASGLLPGDPARYQTFADSMRGAGFVTPLLDGVDVHRPKGAEIFRHVLRVGDVELVPLNSAAYSQVRLDLGIDGVVWEAALSAAKRKGGPEARKVLERLGIVDAARISDRHLEAVHHLLKDARPTPAAHRVGSSKEGRSFLRIAVLHHQLLPVTAEEEVKPFESFTNLGQLRQFLRENEFGVVLHGHKHAPYTYVDYVGSYADEKDPPRQIRVISGPAPSGGTLDYKDVIRLLDIDARAGTIEMESVPAVDAGQPARSGRKEVLSFTPPHGAAVARTAGVCIVDGEVIGDVYARLISTVDTAGNGGDVENVICHIRQAPTVETMASLYPGFAEHLADAPEEDDDISTTVETQLAQFQELVRWWQGPQDFGIGGEPTFTHGSRILKYAGHLDQLATVTKAFLHKATTSRGVVVLLQPSADRIDISAHAFPSFCLVQFLLERGPGSMPPRLNCIAYFRKQEVRYWWLVNVAELVSLQDHIVREVAQRARDDLKWLAKLRPGAVTTISARAHVGRTPPKVQVPKIDQYYATSRERLVDMAHAVVWQQMPARADFAKEWMRLMWDLVPPATRDPDGVAVALPGLKYLAEQVLHHVPQPVTAETTHVQELAAALDALWQQNNAYAAEQKLEQITDSRHKAWRAECTKLVERVAELTVTRIYQSHHGADAAEAIPTPVATLHGVKRPHGNEAARPSRSRRTGEHSGARKQGVKSDMSTSGRRPRRTN